MVSEPNNTAIEFEPILRRHLRSRPAGVCPGFDADLASAYLEGGLALPARSRYEDHLSACAACRHHLIELSRLAPVAVSVAPTRAAEAESRPGWLAEILAGWRERWAWRWSWSLGGAAVAAVALLCAGIFWQFRDRPQFAPAESVRTVGANNPAEVSAGELMAMAEASPTPAVEASPLTPVIPRPSVQPNPAPNQQQMEQLMQRSNPRVSAERTVRPTSEEMVESALQQMVAAQQQQLARQVFTNPDPRRIVPAPLNPGATQMLVTLPSESVARIEPSPDDNPMRTIAMTEQRATRTREARPSGSGETPVWRNRLIGSFVPRDRSEREEKKKTDTSDDESLNPLVRKIQDKTFVYDRGFWVDQAYRDNLMAWRLVRLVLGSKEYERVLQEQPNLKEFFKLRPVIVVWRDKVYRVVEH